MGETAASRAEVPVRDTDSLPGASDAIGISRCAGHSALAVREEPGQISACAAPSFVGRLLVAVIRIYRKTAPCRPKTCRFYPSCSAYAILAIESYGPWRGSIMAAKRILRCHPFHPGGYDPVSGPS